MTFNLEVEVLPIFCIIFCYSFRVWSAHHHEHEVTCLLINLITYQNKRTGGYILLIQKRSYIAEFWGLAQCSKLVLFNHWACAPFLVG